MSRSGSEHAYRQVARLIAERIAEERPGYTPGSVLPSQQDMARQMRLGIDTVRDAYLLLANLGLLTLRQGYGAEVRAGREREIITVPPGTVIAARMPTFAELDEWQLEPGVPLLVVGHEVYPADRFEIRVGETED